MGGPKIPPPPPVPTPPPPPPQLPSKDIAQASTSYAASQAASRGLAGTILTGPSGTGGGSATGKTLTGQ
jgi:hypothetical protein